MNLIELPLELQELLKILIEVGVVFVLTQLAKSGLDLSGYKSQFTAALFTALMVVVDALLAKVPLSLEGIVAALLNLAVVLFAAFGAYKVYRQYVPKP
jgi:hypothetical protein